MDSKKAARRCCSNERARHVHSRDDAIVPQNEWNWAMKRLGWLLGIAFGVMLFIGILAG